MSIDIIKRKNGKRYRVRILKNGRRGCRTFGRHYDAVQFEKEAKANDGIIEASGQTFQNAAQEWLKNHAEVRKEPSSVMMDKNMLANHILPLIGQIKLCRVQPSHIEAIIHKLKQEKDCSNSTVNRNLDVLRAVFNFFLKRRVIYFNPVSVVGRLKVDKRAYDFWSSEEIRSFLEYAKRKYENNPQYATYLFYLIALNTGMRQGELLALKWSDIDFDSKNITVSKSYSCHMRQVKDTTKSHKVRYIPINGDLLRALETAFQGHKRLELVLTWNGNAIDPHNLRQRNFRKDIIESGVKPIRIHDLRHTFASHFMMNGGNPYALQAILGHSSLKMTERYTHHSKAFLEGSANIVSFSGEDNVVKVEFQKQTVGE